ncbi:substrate-binding periplasmic protein [Pseudomonas sp. NPDC089734]|uniref:substrate-binding periplasmic protein n=1 Tax=Pseudomonas sp. NPDC089734 TaxID=3364469 RepID=UPI003801E32E
MKWRLLITGLVLTLLYPVGHAEAAPYIAGGTEWRPFSYSDEQGRLHGISIDIARRVLALAHIDTHFVSYPVNRLQAMMDKDQIDLNYADSPLWTHPDDLNRYVFSIPYLNVKEHLYFIAGHPAAATPVDKLQGMTIGMIRGYTYHALDAALAEKRVSRLETSQDLALLELLQTRRVTAVAMVDDLYEYLIASHRIDPATFQQGAQLSEAPLSIKLQRRHAALLPSINAAILTLQRSGELERTRQSYIPAK